MPIQIKLFFGSSVTKGASYIVWGPDPPTERETSPETECWTSIFF